MVGRRTPASRPVIPPFPPTPYRAMGMLYPPPAAYSGVPSQAHVMLRPQTEGMTWGAQGGKGEEHRRAWEEIGEEGRRLREREARVMGEADKVAEGWTEGPGRPQGGEAQAVEELRPAWADLRRRRERVERAEREGGGHGEGGGLEGRPPLMPFRQPAIPPEQESEMQERACRRMRGEAARLAERTGRWRRGSAGCGRRRRRWPEGRTGSSWTRKGNTSSTVVEGRSPSGKSAKEEGEEAGQERGKQRRVEEQGAGGAEGALQQAGPRPEPTPTNSGSESPPPRRFAPPPVGRGPRTVAGRTAGNVAELVPYVKWAERTRGCAGEAGDPALQRPGQQGGEAQGKGAQDGGGPLDEDARRVACNRVGFPPVGYPPRHRSQDRSKPPTHTTYPWGGMQ